MSTYLKTNAQPVLAAWEQYQQQLNQMRDEGLAFRDSFGAKDAIFQYSIHDNRFCGLIFEPTKDTHFWTHPDKQNKTQRPRQKVPKMTSEEKQQHTQLWQQWSDTYPKIKAKKDDVYASLGTDWGVVWISGLVFFEHQGFVYIETNITLDAPAVELVSSEYAAAKAAYQQGEQS